MKWIDYQEYKFLENFYRQRDLAFALILLLTSRFENKESFHRKVAKLIIKYKEDEIL